MNWYLCYVFCVFVCFCQIALGLTRTDKKYWQCLCKFWLRNSIEIWDLGEKKTNWILRKWFSEFFTQKVYQVCPRECMRAVLLLSGSVKGGCLVTISHQRTKYLLECLTNLIKVFVLLGITFAWRSADKYVKVYAFLVTACRPVLLVLGSALPWHTCTSVSAVQYL